MQGLGGLGGLGGFGGNPYSFGGMGMGPGTIIIFSHNWYHIEKIFFVELFLIQNVFFIIEVAHRELKAPDSSKLGDLRHPADLYYEKLSCRIHPVNQQSKEWKIINKYLSNTHASTHDQYTLQLKNIFAVERLQEKNMFGKYSKEKRMLLWHGSRLTNWFGILSQGLKIAPPEAPVSGYMFGQRKESYLFTTHFEKMFSLCPIFVQ